MAISRTGPPHPPAPVPALKGSQKGALSEPRSRLSDEERAGRASREAQARIEEADKRVHEAEREADVRIEHLRGGSERQAEAEAVRQEAAIEAEKNRGYAAIRELRQAQQAELNRVRRQGERELAQAQSYYRDTIYGTEKRGREELDQLQAQQEAEKNFSQQTHIADMTDAKNAQAYETERMKAHEEAKVRELEASSREQYERYRQNTADARKKAETEFKSKYHSVKSEYDSTLADIGGQASAEIRKTRQDTAAKLAAYSARQSDAFYKMIDLDASLRDAGDSFVLTATIPEHERDHLSVSVRGNQVVLSGARRNEEKLELGPGRSKSTNSYQAYHETFSLDWPIDTKSMTKVFDGDELIVTIPKRSALSEPVKREAHAPERARLERPKFPGNLPVEKEEQLRGDLNLPPDGPDGPVRKRTTRTLA